MSFHEYLACSHPLPSGDFGKPPLRVYESYSDFMDSPDYRAPEERKRLSAAKSACADRENRERQLRRLEGRILIYAHPNDVIMTIMVPLPAGSLSAEAARQLSLPYVYIPYGNTLDYLCLFLAQEGHTELLRQWEGHGKALTRAPQDLHIDLESYVQTRKWPKTQFYDSQHNTFATISPLRKPRSCDPDLRLLRKAEQECIARAFISEGSYSVHFDLAQLQRQGVF